MTYIKRIIQSRIEKILNRGKSILLLGPRQTGKSTLLEHQIKADLTYSFIESEVRRRYESNPELLVKEIKAFVQIQKIKKDPLVFIDEIQKVPMIMDTIQYAIDKKMAKFILTGSSARKLKRNKEKEEVNLLPGRVIELHLDALSLLEIGDKSPDINDLLLNGCLPEVFLQNTMQNKEELLTSYVNIYLEEEIRAEAIVRNLAHFSRFLNYAAIESGQETNINNLSREIGVSRYTIGEYYQILEDCLIVSRIEPITNLTTRRRLTKSPKYLFFDMGIRRVAAGEGLKLPKIYFGQLFEQFVGIELLKVIRLYAPQAKLRYWRNHAGPEVDYVIEYNRQYLPIEVKWHTSPSKGDAKHLINFMQEYQCYQQAYIVCQTSKPYEVTDNVLAISWAMLPQMIKDILNENLM